jgi:hypothetical protein
MTPMTLLDGSRWLGLPDQSKSPPPIEAFATLAP